MGLQGWIGSAPAAVSTETGVTLLWSREWRQTISAALDGHKGVNAVASSPQQKHLFCAAEGTVNGNAAEEVCKQSQQIIGPPP